MSASYARRTLFSKSWIWSTFCITMWLKYVHTSPTVLLCYGSIVDLSKCSRDVDCTNTYLINKSHLQSVWDPRDNVLFFLLPILTILADFVTEILCLALTPPIYTSCDYYVCTRRQTYFYLDLVLHLSILNPYSLLNFWSHLFTISYLYIMLIESMHVYETVSLRDWSITPLPINIWFDL